MNKLFSYQSILFVLTVCAASEMILSVTAASLITDASIQFESIDPMAADERQPDEMQKIAFKYSPEGKFILEKAAESRSMGVAQVLSVRGAEESWRQSPETFFNNLSTAIYKEYREFQFRDNFGNAIRELVNDEIITIPINRLIPVKTSTKIDMRKEITDAVILGASIALNKDMRKAGIGAIGAGATNTGAIGASLVSIIKTEEASSKIPEELKTTGWRTYVSPGVSENSNTYGAYGLLNELSAHYYRDKTVVDCHQYIYEYLDKKGYSSDLLRAYTQSFMNSELNFYEFSFWTLQYFSYLQERHPEHYRNFIDNEIFRAAFIYFYDNYKELATETIPEIIKSISNKLNGMNIESSEIEHLVRIERLLIGNSSEQITLLKNELSLPKYIVIMNELRKGMPYPNNEPFKQSGIVANFVADGQVADNASFYLDEETEDEFEDIHEYGDPSYSGQVSGELIWEGEIRGTTLVTIDGLTASAGRIVGGNPLPGVPCSIVLSDYKNAVVAALPVPADGYKTVVLQVSGRGKIRVILRWAVLQDKPN